jgi:hypothetical protein
MNDSPDEGIVIQMPASGALVLSAESVRAFTTAGRPWLVSGYSGAVDRFRAASERDDRSPKAVFFPLFEALNWFDAADEYLNVAGAPIRERHVRAVRYARRRVHHQWADALRAVEYEIESGAGPVRISWWTFDWFWKPEENLPPAPPKYADPMGARMYRDLLADRPAREALESVERYLKAQL